MKINNFFKTNEYCFYDDDNSGYINHKYFNKTRLNDLSNCYYRRYVEPDGYDYFRVEVVTDPNDEEILIMEFIEN